MRSSSEHVFSLSSVSAAWICICIFPLLSIGATGATNYTYVGSGFCFGAENSYGAFTRWSAEECWTACEAHYESSSSELVAINIDWKIDWYSNVSYANCYCQDACGCLDDVNSEFTLYVANDFLNAPSTALDACTDSPAVMPSDVGTCDLSSKQFSTAYSSALECWDACWEYYGQKTWAANWREEDGACFCSTECNCRGRVGNGSTLVTQSSLAASVDELPGLCDYTLNPWHFLDSCDGFGTVLAALFIPLLDDDNGYDYDSGMSWDYTATFLLVVLSVSLGTPVLIWCCSKPPDSQEAPSAYASNISQQHQQVLFSINVSGGVELSSFSSSFQRNNPLNGGQHNTATRGSNHVNFSISRTPELRTNAVDSEEIAAYGTSAYVVPTTHEDLVVEAVVVTETCDDDGSSTSTFSPMY